jgi:gamma-glutamyltranspeptidase/glutathione hydrolase
MQVLANIVDYGMSVQEAIEHPRMLARGNSFEMESTVPESIWAALREKGHFSHRLAQSAGYLPRDMG